MRTAVLVGVALLVVVVAGTGLIGTQTVGDVAQRLPFVASSSARQANSEAATAAIQQAIQRGNDAQARAIATRDPSPMAETATTDYYQELVETNQDLLDGGVTAVELLRTEWGPIEVRGNTATATVYETWRVTFADGTTEESRERNVYTLVQSDGAWKIQSDEHPDQQQP